MVIWLQNTQGMGWGATHECFSHRGRWIIAGDLAHEWSCTDGLQNGQRAAVCVSSAAGREGWWVCSAQEELPSPQPARMFTQPRKREQWLPSHWTHRVGGEDISAFAHTPSRQHQYHENSHDVMVSQQWSWNTTSWIERYLCNTQSSPRQP